MKEEYLHFLWKHKQIPFHLMKLTNGDSFVLKKTGKYNLESGPDFFDGEIIIDSICWRGNIEIHVKSSDWNLHKHQFDKAYDNVVLHVVYEHDVEIEIGGRFLPTLELKKYIEIDHFKNYTKKAVNSDFLCQPFFFEIDQIYLDSMKEKAIIERLNQKIKFLENSSFFEIDQVLYQFLGRAFGMKVNSIPFQELTNTLPLRILKRESKESISSLVIGASGLIFESKCDEIQKRNWIFLKEKHSLRTMPTYIWKKKGLRPSGFPLVRLTQFSKTLEKFDFNTVFTYYEIPEMLAYFYSVLDFSDEINFVNLHLKMSKSTKEMIILNCFVPFVWWFGTYKNDEIMKEKSLEILSLLKAESNSITQKWSELGLKIKNAYDSQALLEIYNEFCSQKKCLSCTVGNKIIKG